MIKKPLGLWAAIRRQTIQQHIDSELAYHVETRTRALQATGLGPAAAPPDAPRPLRHRGPTHAGRRPGWRGRCGFAAARCRTSPPAR